MTLEEAKQVIEALARGIDPETGELLPEDNPINSPYVIRALFLAAQALGQRVDSPKADKPARAKAAAPTNAGKAWTEDEAQQLAAAFDAGSDVATLAQAHGRTPGAIRARLIRMGRLQDDASAS
jgi:hypothetical protein